jgi:hypothetical protein
MHVNTSCVYISLEKRLEPITGCHAVSQVQFRNVLIVDMLRKGLTIIVVLFAVFTGLIWYNVYLTISPKLKGDQKLIPFLFNFNNELSKIFDDKLGIVPKYKWFRWFFTTLSTSSLFPKPDLEAKGITIKDSVISGIPVKIFRPDEADGESQYRPGLIFLHGGGLVFGSVNWTCYIQQCIMIAQGVVIFPT